MLCDVPCSGDGTMRKAPDIWRRWTVANGNGLHGLQINITLRACQLLKVRPRLVTLSARSLELDSHHPLPAETPGRHTIVTS